MNKHASALCVCGGVGSYGPVACLMQSNTDCCIDKSGTLCTGSCNVRSIGSWGGFDNAQAHTTSLTNPGSQYAASCHVRGQG